MPDKTENTEQKQPVGRPSVFSQDIADEILEGLIDGKSLRAMCLEPHMPNVATVIRWLADPRYDEFCAQYSRARMVQADTLADEVLHISNTPVMGIKTKTLITGEGEDAKSVTEQIEGDMTDHRKLQIHARQWYAGKLAPQKYGAKLATEISGPNGDPISVSSRVELYLPDNGRRPKPSS